jgi:hypothetical protein
MARIGHDLQTFLQKFMPKQKFVQQQSGDWAIRGQVSVARTEGWTALARTNGRMNTIQHIKTMAGSPDADFALRSASRNLAHGFMCLAFMPSMEP